MDFRSASIAYLNEQFRYYRNPQFVTLLFKKCLNVQRRYIKIDEQECLRAMEVLQRRLNARLYQGKHRLALFGCLELNEEQRYHWHFIVDWPLGKLALRDALDLDWRGVVPKKGDLRWALCEAHFSEVCDEGAVSYIAKLRTKLPESGRFDPLIMELGPSSMDLCFEALLPSCEWQSPYQRFTDARLQRSLKLTNEQAIERVWQGRDEPIFTAMPISTSKARNTKRRLPQAKPRSVRKAFVVERKRSRASSRCSTLNEAPSGGSAIHQAK